MNAGCATNRWKSKFWTISSCTPANSPYRAASNGAKPGKLVITFECRKQPHTWWWRVFQKLHLYVWLACRRNFAEHIATAIGYHCACHAPLSRWMMMMMVMTFVEWVTIHGNNDHADMCCAMRNRQASQASRVPCWWDCPQQFWRFCLSIKCKATRHGAWLPPRFGLVLKQVMDRNKANNKLFNFEKQGISYHCCNPIKSRQSNGCHHMIQGANSQQHKVDEQWPCQAELWFGEKHENTGTPNFRPLLPKRQTGTELLCRYLKEWITGCSNDIMMRLPWIVRNGTHKKQLWWWFTLDIVSSKATKSWKATERGNWDLQVHLHVFAATLLATWSFWLPASSSHHVNSCRVHKRHTPHNQAK